MRGAAAFPLQRATSDETHGLSRDPAFLRDHYAATAQALRDMPPDDLVVDTGATAIGEAACTGHCCAKRSARCPPEHHR